MSNRSTLRRLWQPPGRFEDRPGLAAPVATGSVVWLKRTDAVALD